MSGVVAVCFGVLAVSGLLCVARVVRPGSSLPDRLVAIDALLVVIVTGVGLGALTQNGRRFLDLLVVTSLIGFTGTVTVARFIERRGA